MEISRGYVTPGGKSKIENKHGFPWSKKCKISVNSPGRSW